MPLQELIRRIENEGAQAVARELESAQAQAAAIIAGEQQATDSAHAAALVAYEAKLRQAMQPRFAEARAEARRQVLVARERMLERAFDAMRARFDEVKNSDEYAAHRSELLAAARSYVAAEATTLTDDGARLLSAGGDVWIDLTLESELMRRAPQLRMLLCAHVEAHHADRVADA